MPCVTRLNNEAVGKGDLTEQTLHPPLKARRRCERLIEVERVIVAAKFAEQPYILNGESPRQLSPGIHGGGASELDLESIVT